MRTVDTIAPGELVRLEGEAVGAPTYAEVVSRRGASLRVRWHGHEYLAAGAAVLGADDAARPVVGVRRFEPWQVATDRRQPRAKSDAPAEVPAAPKVSEGGDGAEPWDSRGGAQATSNVPTGPVTGAGDACEGGACCHEPPTAPDAPSTEREAPAP